MADTNIKPTLDYLQDLFEKLSDGQIDPARVDWPFAAEAWLAVCRKIERLHREIQCFSQELGDLTLRLQATERVAATKSLKVEDLQSEQDELRTGIQSIIRQARQSAIMDFQAVADKLEALLPGPGEGG